MPCTDEELRQLRQCRVVLKHVCNVYGFTQDDVDILLPTLGMTEVNVSSALLQYGHIEDALMQSDGGNWNMQHVYCMKYHRMICRWCRSAGLLFFYCMSIYRGGGLL